MTTCWDPSPMQRPSMQYVVDEMNMLCQFVHGADLPLEYYDDDLEVYTNSFSPFIQFYNENIYFRVHLIVMIPLIK